MRTFLVVLTILLIQSTVFGQILEFDQLEMRYDQKQYKTVYKRAKKLNEDPAYDFSYLPRYYMALSQLQLAQNKKWFRRNKYAVEDAHKLFTELKGTKEGQEILRAHQYELSVLKNDLSLWMYTLDSEGERATLRQVGKLVETIFDDVPDVETMREDHLVVEKPSEGSTSQKDGTSSDVITVTSLTDREEIVKISEGLLGVPYKWAGVTPEGFDCSGFTGYVIRKSLKKNLSHRAADQYKEVKKVKRKDVQVGDLIFFSNGGTINHVGIVYSMENNSIQMIHSSSSIGISIVDIYESAYWKRRIVGFGTIVEE